MSKTFTELSIDDVIYAVNTSSSTPLSKKVKTTPTELSVEEIRKWKRGDNTFDMIYEARNHEDHRYAQIVIEAKEKDITSKSIAFDSLYVTPDKYLAINKAKEIIESAVKELNEQITQYENKIFHDMAMKEDLIEQTKAADYNIKMLEKSLN